MIYLLTYWRTYLLNVDQKLKVVETWKLSVVKFLQAVCHSYAQLMLSKHWRLMS